MIITIEQLKQKKACAEGIVWFKKQYGNSINRAVLTNDLITAKKYGWFKWMIKYLCDDIELERKIEMGIKCALVVYTEESFVDWANNWLSGINRDKSAAWSAWAKSARSAAEAAVTEAWSAAEAAAVWSAAKAAAAAADAVWSAAKAAEAAEWSAEAAELVAEANETQKQEIIDVILSYVN